MNRLDEARRKWGDVFSDFRSACELVNSAWYEMENKRALKDENIQRLHALIKEAQKEIDTWEVQS